MQPRVTSHCHQVKWIFPPFSGPRIQCVSFLLWATGCYFCKVTASVTSSLRPFGTIDLTEMPHLHYMQAGSMVTLCQLNDAGNCGGSGQRLCPCAEFLYLPGQPADRAEFCRLGNFVHRHGGLRSGLGSSSETLPDLWVSVFFFCPHMVDSRQQSHMSHPYKGRFSFAKAPPSSHPTRLWCWSGSLLVN